MIADSLLENLGFRKTALGFPIPDENFLSFHLIALALRPVGQVDLEETTRCWNECYFAYGGAKGGQKLLAEVGGSKHPAALGAVCDRYPGEMHWSLFQGVCHLVHEVAIDSEVCCICQRTC